MSTKKPTPPEQPDDKPDAPPIEIEVPVEPGKPISFGVPEGVQNVTINIDPTLLGQSGATRPPENSFQSCSRSCGSVLLGVVGILFVLWLIGSIFGR